MELLIILWIGFAILCGVIAISKNRSFAGWTFIGILFPFLAFILIMCLSPLDARQKENTTKNCPFCGENIMKVAKKCKYCGEFLPVIKGINRNPKMSSKVDARKNEKIQNKIKEWNNA